MSGMEKNIDIHSYDDMIGLPHHVSARHPRMPLSDRAAQFSPFAALTGYDAIIQETARLTEEFAELDEDRKAQLDERLRMIKETLNRRDNPERKQEVIITYFEPDAKKSGGRYVTACGRVKKIDEQGRRILLEDRTIIPMDSLLAIEGEWFGRMEDIV